MVIPIILYRLSSHMSIAYEVSYIMMPLPNTTKVYRYRAHHPHLPAPTILGLLILF